MRLSVNLVHGGKYIRAGDELPPDFVLPPHLDRFAGYDDQPPQQTSRADLRFSSEGHREDIGAETRPAKSAMRYPEGEEEFIPKPKFTRGSEPVGFELTKKKRK
jgi:hypothetical protein